MGPIYVMFFIVFLCVVGLVFLINLPNFLPGDSVGGRAEQRAKREAEQWLYVTVIGPLVSVILSGAALFLFLFVCALFNACGRPL